MWYHAVQFDSRRQQWRALNNNISALKKMGTFMRRRLLCIFIIKQLINYSIQRDYIITIFLPVALFCYFSYKPNFPFHSNVFLNAAPKTRGRVFQSKKKREKNKKTKNNFSFPVPLKLPPLLFGAFPPPLIYRIYSLYCTYYIQYIYSSLWEVYTFHWPLE